MKYSEFKQEVEAIGLYVVGDMRELYIESMTDTMVSVDTEERFNFDCDWTAFSQLDETTQTKIYDLAYKLAKTPLAEREEEKLYNVIFPTIQRDRNFIYMVKDNSNGDPLGIDWSDSNYMKGNPTKFAFTEQEIKDIDERYLAFKVEVTPE